MPIVGKLSTTVWGASTVGARDPANGLEDNGANGGVGPQKETYFYWDGKIIKGEDGKFHMYASHWNYSIGFGPPGGGSTGWETSIPMQAISDNVMGPYVSQGNCYTKNQGGNNEGHNVTALITPTGTSPYTLSVGEIVPGQMFNSSSANGPWALMGLLQTNTNGHSGCGTLSSNFTFTVGPDNRFWATSRGGCIMDSANVLGPYKVETNSILPNLENNDNGDAEDEVIWYSGGYYHIVYNYWNVQRGYHIMSKDGTSNWTSTGLAYQGTQSPSNASSKWLRYMDGTVNQWHNMERVGVYQENGHVTHFTFAVTDVDKNGSGVNNGGSKILVVPFDGVQFDCDNGDSASCAEVGAVDGGAGGSGAGGTGGGSGRGGGGGSDHGGSGGSSGAGIGGSSGAGGAGLGSGGIGGGIPGTAGRGGSPAGGVGGSEGMLGGAGMGGVSTGGSGLGTGGASSGTGAGTGGVATGNGGAGPGSAGIGGAGGRGSAGSGMTGSGAAGTAGAMATSSSGCHCEVESGGSGSAPCTLLLAAAIAVARGSRRRRSR
jgi:hypothetical protein